MEGTQAIKVTLQRDSLHTPWGFRLQGGADFCMPFAINKITAGSPADGVLHRGDVIHEIDNRPISGMQHAEALAIVQRAGGQVSFLVQRGLTPLASIMYQQRPTSAMPWSLTNATSYLEKNFNHYWPSSEATATAVNSPHAPTALYRSRPLERIADPKSVLSQTGSPLMPGPVPSVSTKTRGYTQPPVFHTERNYGSSASPADFSYPPARYNNYSSPAQNSSNHKSNIYLPSYQKKVVANPIVQRSNINDAQRQRNHQQYVTITRQQHHHHQQQQPYRPSSVQAGGLVNRQYNSPMSLYSNDNVQEVMKNHVNHVTRVSIIPSTPNPPRVNYAVAVTPSHNTHTTANAPVCYVQSRPNVYASDF
ncbi:unnamed protein product [Rotaria magnacalcarata]|uniref:PDZ domain-containing protein n=2 Tax=Rotaria magnacalcarata TaxID=392030 RepID=A0A817A7C5_9BILA|nr:unnamed protein product [Rotaria magnacalcarata]CAF2252081.1 unnamed protein product [Rotaria magnacalcarata]CAF3898957.1 unnamed protein product [Rotaria magnacalcarata]